MITQSKYVIVWEQTGHATKQGHSAEALFFAIKAHGVAINVTDGTSTQ
jgi:hypothetical protein